MEKRMEEYADEIMQQERAVRGVLCTDSNGALLCARGSLAGPADDTDGRVAAHSAAVAAQLANLATALEPNAQPLAIVLSRSVDRLSPALSVTTTPMANNSTTPASATGDSKVLIKRSGPVTVALHK
ncbi:hypothetical protein niasHT_025225 [Heterodera trifolii]|uniref:Late endosomal/lysosomal adaptor and MAPK and MTOR activator 5 n=1 Tax=Heterodera trifolii TaxID=157864 RepID=A0ABD2JGI8_9BILA